MEKGDGHGRAKAMDEVMAMLLTLSLACIAVAKSLATSNTALVWNLTLRPSMFVILDKSSMAIFSAEFAAERKRRALPRAHSPSKKKTQTRSFNPEASGFLRVCILNSLLGQRASLVRLLLLSRVSGSYHL